MFIDGGIVFSLHDNIVKIVSTAPAAPSKCPNEPFKLEMKISFLI